MRRSSKLAERTRWESRVFTVKLHSSLIPRFLTESDEGADALATVKESAKEEERERSGLFTLSTLIHTTRESTVRRAVNEFVIYVHQKINVKMGGKLVAGYTCAPKPSTVKWAVN